jgi:acyl-CoA synthetase (AMP-forming)/AMP-acid ligase II
VICTNRGLIEFTFCWSRDTMPEEPLIIHGGRTVFPREVERVLLSHPGVAEAIVVGVPDRSSGEIVGAAVRLSPSGPCAAELTAFCRARLAPYKLPVRWLFTGSLPRTVDGTPDRAMLTVQLAVAALDRSSWTAQVDRCDPARPLSATKDLRIPQQVRRSWALEDLDYL